MGNLYSVRNTFKSLGIMADIIDGPAHMFDYDKLILPGVGAFGDAMSELRRRRFIKPIKDFISQGRPFLGICLGMQLLMEKSAESIGIEGLSVVKGDVSKFSLRLKCPHMGWNRIEKAKKGMTIFKGLKSDIYAYFCHSFYVRPKDKAASIGLTEYGVKFASIIKQGNIYGMQFHPEKSQDVGLKILENFIQLC